MNKTKRNIIAATAVCAALSLALMGCSLKKTESGDSAIASAPSVQTEASVQSDTSSQAALNITEPVTLSEDTEKAEPETTSGTAEAESTDLFTTRDLSQTADLTDAVSMKLEDGKTYTIDTEGVYLISGTAENAQIVVDAGAEAKVQLVLDGVSVTNDSVPCIYVKNADKVFVTVTDSENSLSVTGEFTTDGDTKTDAVIFSKDDLVLNGVGTLSISSSDNAVSSKDDLKITGGTYEISCSGTAFEAHELIAVADGTINVASCNDGLHAENDEDDSVGEVRILGGSIQVKAADDGIHATTTATIDGGNIALTAAEGIEATVVRINDGTLSIEASDDGINAAAKSSALSILAEFNGGSTTIVMGSGDTDAVDSNGDLIINDGTLNITAQSPFDYDGTAQKNGGTIIVNGQETEELSNQFGGGMGGPQGGMNGGFGGHGGMGGPQGGMPGGF